jgi:hypothetical protein
MSEFDGLFEAFAIPQQMTLLGDTSVIDYADASDTKAGETTTTDITAIVDEERTRTEPTEYGEKLIRVREVHVHTDPDSVWKGITSPELRGTITYDGGVWSVREIISKTPDWCHFEVTYIRQMEHAKEGLRRE